jgi:hypothetical protein
VEGPYLLVQSLLYAPLTYFLIGLEYSAGKLKCTNLTSLVVLSQLPSQEFSVAFTAWISACHLER